MTDYTGKNQIGFDYLQEKQFFDQHVKTASS